MRYPIGSEHDGWLGGLAFRSASWALQDRAAYIGWNAAQRRQNLHRVVPDLASHVLGRASQRLPTDGAARFGVAPVLLETLVDPTRFDGTSGQLDPRRPELGAARWYRQIQLALRPGAAVAQEAVACLPDTPRSFGACGFCGPGTPLRRALEATSTIARRPAARTLGA